MCCSVSPGTPVRFSDTALLAAEALHPDGETVHVLGYQNKVKARVGLLARVRSWLPLRRFGNAMLLPFPAVPRTMTADNVVATKECPDVLQDIAKAVSARPSLLPSWSKEARGWAAPEVQVFEAAGIYTVVLAADARGIPAALDRVPPEKRPRLNRKLFDAYAAWYPGWTFALCCFDDRAASLADPLLWWYRPTDPDRLFLPTLDSHTGRIPNLDARVSVDHTLAVASHRMVDGKLVYYTRRPSEVRPFLPRYVIGERYGSKMKNGDFVCELNDVRAGNFLPVRTDPPGAGS